MSDIIRVRNLIKIFGPRAGDYVDKVRNGMSKRELNEEHGHVLGLYDINMSVPAGEILVVMGLSGSGKSTLIRHINRLIDPTDGEILCDGTDITRLNDRELRDFRQRRMAMVFQKFALLPHRTVNENVGYGLELQGISPEERRRRAGEWIERVGLHGYGDLFPNQLSGGMQQRVGLARALTSNADILLMDEAYSALDPLIRVDMQNMLLDLQKELKKTVVFITHDLDEALKLGNRIVILREGVINQQGTGEEIVLNPANDYVASFVKEVNRGRVLTIEHLAGRAGPASTSFRLDRATSLQQALRAMGAAGTEIAEVVDGSRVLGTVGYRNIVDVMVQ